MNVVAKLYQIQLDEKEVEQICNSLHKAITDLKANESALSNTKDAEQLIVDLSGLRMLRTSLGNLIGRTWMGKDY